MSNQHIIHVALIGETGVGKSSIVNVLSGQKVAKVNNEAIACTTEATEYMVVDADTTYHIWDTRGINEAKVGKLTLARVAQMLGLISAEHELKKLLRTKDPDLVLLCVHRKNIGISDHWSIYSDIYASLRRERMKMAILVTRLRESDLQDSRWKETCLATARLAFKESLDASMIEGVPHFNNLDDQKVKDCRDKILTLISTKSC